MEQTLGRYQLLRILGRGAMGVVYEGVDPKLSRQVAVKTILKSQLVDPGLAAEYTARFMREAQAVARLNHPNIVTVFDFGNESDVTYLVMEFIRGKELKSFLEEKRLLGIEEVVHIVSELLQALNYAHEHGVIHRDIKPANVMLDGTGRVKLTDFGVARLSDSGSSEGTRPGTMVGTPGYMAPEQIKGLTVGPQADIFATGVLLYQCLTLQKPFTGSSDWEVYHKIVNEDPPPLSQFREGIPAALEAVVRKALAKEPRDRFATAAAMAEELRQSVSGRAFDDEATRLVYDVRSLPPSADRSHVTTATTSPSRTGTTDAERDFWNSIKDSGDIEELKEFLIQFPESIFANLARIRINKLSGGGTAVDASGLRTNPPAARAEEDEAQRKAREEARLKAEEEARRQVEQERQRQAQKEAQRRIEEETRRRAEEEAARRTREEAERSRTDAELRRKADEEAQAEALRRQDAEKRKEAEAKRAAEEARRRQEEERAQERAAEEERARLKAEAEARLRANEEARRRQEAEARQRAEEEARLRAAEEEARRTAAEAARRKVEDETRTLAAFESRSEDADDRTIVLGRSLPPTPRPAMPPPTQAPAASPLTPVEIPAPEPARPLEGADQPRFATLEVPKPRSRMPLIAGGVAVALLAAGALLFGGGHKDKPADNPSQPVAAPAPRSEPPADAAERQREQARQLEDARKADDARQSQAKAAESARQAEESRKAEESRQMADAKRAEEARRKDEARRLEEARKAEDARKQADARKAEEARKKEEARKAEEVRKKEEARQAFDASPEGMLKKAREAKKAGDAKAAVKLYTQAYNGGSGQAAKELGDYYQAPGPDHDSDFAELWYGRARQKGVKVGK